MRLFLLGATGKAGSAFLEQALGHGHFVTAFVRTPDKIAARHSNLTVVQGDALNLDALTAHLPGHDAVVSALSPGTLGPSTLQRRFMENVTVGMSKSRVERLIVLSVTFLFQDAGLITSFFGHTLFDNIRKGSGEMEQVVQSSALDWTIVRLPRLTSDIRPGKYNARTAQPPPARSISRGSVANFVLTEVEQNQYRRTVVGVSA
jgi:putative NADH-flavin reductase